MAAIQKSSTNEQRAKIPSRNGARMGLDHDEKLVATIGGYKQAETTEAEKDGELAQVSVSRAAATRQRE